MKEVILTGERPTGPLHIGHYAGALKKRVELQNTNKYDIYILIADLQALTDNFDNPKKIRDNILEVVIDNLEQGYNYYGFSEGLARVSIGKEGNEKYGFIDKTGKIVIGKF